MSFTIYDVNAFIGELQSNPKLRRALMIAVQEMLVEAEALADLVKEEPPNKKQES